MFNFDEIQPRIENYFSQMGTYHREMKFKNSIYRLSSWLYILLSKQSLFNKIYYFFILTFIFGITSSQEFIDF